MTFLSQTHYLSRRRLRPHPRRHFALLLHLVSCLSLIATVGGSHAYGDGVDLDVASATRTYNSTLQIANDRYQAYQTEAAKLQAAERDVSAARNQLDQAERSLETAQARVLTSDRQLDSLEREIDQQNRDLDRAEWNLRTAERELASAQRRYELARTDVQNLERRLKDINQRISELEKEDDSKQQVARLKRQRDQIIKPDLNRSKTERDLAAADQSKFKNEVDETTRQIYSIKRSQVATQRKLADERRRRDDAADKVLSARSAIRTASRRLEDRRATYSNVRLVYLQAQSAYESAKRNFDEAKRYLNVVKANYEAVRQAILAKASEAGHDQGGHAAADRASTAGKVAGQAAGFDEGKSKGTSDAKARDFDAGYRLGRQQGNSSAHLAESYAKGVRLGSQMATAKATAEDFGRGFNDAAKAAAAEEQPSQTTLVDITTQTSDAAGGPRDLAGVTRSVGPGPTPRVALPTVPTLQPPLPHQANITIPEPTIPQPRSSCEGLRLPEVGEQCLSAFRRSFAIAFDTAYRKHYQSSFTDSFTRAAGAAYQQQLAGQQTEDYAKGMSTGATDQGRIDGFEANLSKARQTEYLRGQQSFARLRKESSLLRVAEVSLIDSNGDGVLMAGEAARLTVTVDNLGEAPSPNEMLRIIVSGRNGLGNLSFTTRQLPSIAGNTRATLVGVVAAPVLSKIAGAKLALTGTVERLNDGQYQAIRSFESTAETRFPIELTELTWPENASLNVKTDLTLTFTNKSNRTSTTRNISLKSPGLNFDQTPLVTLPALEPGEAAEVTTEVIPGPAVAYGVKEEVTAQLLDDQDQVITEQVVEKRLNLARLGALQLLDENGRAASNNIIRARPGYVWPVGMIFRYFADQSNRGPIVLEWAGSSLPGVKPANNTAISVNYGAWSPSRRAPQHYFRLQIPRSAAGKAGTAKFRLRAGSEVLHELTVQLEIPSR